MMEFGIVTFAETTTDAQTGKKVASGERLRHLIEEIELADRVGLDVYGSASITGPISRRRRPR